MQIFYLSQFYTYEKGRKKTEIIFFGVQLNERVKYRCRFLVLNLLFSM